MGKQEDYTSVIQQLRENVPDITGVMIASADGLSISTDFPEAEAARVAAMAPPLLVWATGSARPQNWVICTI